MRFKG